MRKPMRPSTMRLARWRSSRPRNWPRTLRAVSSDNYNSFSGDSYFSRSFWGKSARGFCVFLGSFSAFAGASLWPPGVAAKGRHQRRAEGILRA
jgi:hypothetical protein